jgi:hypothetical protein
LEYAGRRRRRPFEKLTPEAFILPARIVSRLKGGMDE